MADQSEPSPPRLLLWLQRRVENIAAALLAAIFITFLLQILFRYFLAWPVGWTLEVSTLAWMWLVLWGAAFVVRDEDEIRFDVLYGAVKGRVRRGFIIVSSLALAALLVISMPAVVDYVTFMKVEKVSYIGLRLDYAFSLFIVFAVAVIVRCLWRAWFAFRPGSREPNDPGAPGGMPEA